MASITGHFITLGEMTGKDKKEALLLGEAERAAGH